MKNKTDLNILKIEMRAAEIYHLGFSKHGFKMFKNSEEANGWIANLRNRMPKRESADALAGWLAREIYKDEAA